MTSEVRRWFQLRLRTLLCAMVLTCLASALWKPVIRPWIYSRQRDDEFMRTLRAVEATFVPLPDKPLMSPPAGEYYEQLVRTRAAQQRAAAEFGIHAESP